MATFQSSKKKAQREAALEAEGRSQKVDDNFSDLPKKA
jgi:hypothetical protein